MTMMYNGQAVCRQAFHEGGCVWWLRQKLASEVDIEAANVVAEVAE